jgi:hypothetical protein
LGGREQEDLVWRSDQANISLKPLSINKSWHAPVIPAKQEAQIRGLAVQAIPDINSRPYLKNN